MEVKGRENEGRGGQSEGGEGDNEKKELLSSHCWKEKTAVFVEKRKNE